MRTKLYGAAHFLVDMLCAWAMFGRFRGSAARILIYNFCAFALQMPLGTWLDLLRDREDDRTARLPFLWAAAGGVLTVIGTVTNPAILGIGNALFHVGGGMEVIDEDFCLGTKGRGMGIFVAPGAIGLYLGTQLGGLETGKTVLLLVVLALFFLMGALFQNPAHHRTECGEPTAEKRQTWTLGICCLAVVILRSFVGLSVSFPWKQGYGYGAAAVVAVALGKVMGGLLAARFGARVTVAVSLSLSAVCFLLGDVPLLGLMALWLFNMSMPVTLYLLACRLPRLPGFAFGLLTFGLFLGFLPVYAGWSLPIGGNWIGALGSLLSVALLLLGMKREVRWVAPD